MSGSEQRGYGGESGVKAARNVYLIVLARRGSSDGPRYISENDT